MPLLHYRDLASKNLNTFTGDTIIVLSEDTNDSAKKIAIGDVADHLSPGAYSAFRASATIEQTVIGSSGWTNILFQSESFDLGSEFSNNAFTPLKDGYYFFTATINTHGIATAGPEGVEARIVSDPSVEVYARYRYLTFSSAEVDRPMFSLNTIIYVTTSETIRVQLKDDSLSNITLGIEGRPVGQNVNFSGCRIT